MVDISVHTHTHNHTCKQKQAANTYRPRRRAKRTYKESKRVISDLPLKKGEYQNPLFDQWRCSTPDPGTNVSAVLHRVVVSAFQQLGQHPHQQVSRQSCDHW
jgi:hypothetical protein